MRKVFKGGEIGNIEIGTRSKRFNEVKRVSI